VSVWRRRHGWAQAAGETYEGIAGLLLCVDDARCEDCAGAEGGSHGRDDGALGSSQWLLLLHVTGQFTHLP
jgi:hypothetical protein